MKSPKIDTSGTAAALEANRRANEQAMNLQKNFAADLGTNDISNVVAGGTAESEGVPESTFKRKKHMGSLSSQLGIQ